MQTLGLIEAATLLKMSAEGLRRLAKAKLFFTGIPFPA